MVSALGYLGTLPNQTIVYVGHEYTKDNLAFAKHIDPSNARLTKLQEIVENHKITTGQSTIGDEKQWNVFMRLDTDAVRFFFCFPLHSLVVCLKGSQESNVCRKLYTK